jgi:hypothetical protein
LKKIIISFGGFEQGKNRHNTSFNIHRDYSAEVKRLFKSSEHYFDECWEYNNDWIHASPYWNSPARKVLEEPSFGWAFKSICILDALRTIEENDIVVWMDSNDLMVANPKKMFDFCQFYDIYCHDHFPAMYPTALWCNKDTFVRMGCDEPKYWLVPQIQVNIMAFCKRERTMRIIEEWAQHSTDYETMIQNIMPNPPGFCEHRHEQAVFSILTVKHNIYCAKGYPYEIAREENGISI